MGVTVDERRGVECEVQELVAVHVDQVGAVTGFDVGRIRLKVGAVAGIATR
jgi:hypothetical protein